MGAGLEAILHLGRFPTYRLLTPSGSLVFGLGAGLAAWGWLIFWSRRTTRVPGEASSTLVTWGPYQFTRNPMYIGLAVAYLGEACIVHQVIPVILLPLLIAYLNQFVIPIERNGYAGSLVMSTSAMPARFAVGCEPGLDTQQALMSPRQGSTGRVSPPNLVCKKTSRNVGLPQLVCLKLSSIAGSDN
jgi:hypothetical protein